MKENKRRSYAIIALVASVLTLTVAFVVLNQTLAITSNARVRDPSWNVAFSNLSEPILSGDAHVLVPAQLSAGGTSLSFEVELFAPGDSVVYTFNVQNFGTINTKVIDTSLTGVLLANANDIMYTLTYADGTTVSPGDLLDAGTNRTLRLTIEFDSNSTAIPLEGVVLSLGATINYVQN